MRWRGNASYQGDSRYITWHFTLRFECNRACKVSRCKLVSIIFTGGPFEWYCTKGLYLPHTALCWRNYWRKYYLWAILCETQLVFWYIFVLSLFMLLIAEWTPRGWSIFIWYLVRETERLGSLHWTLVITKGHVVKILDVAVFSTNTIVRETASVDQLVSDLSLWHSYFLAH